MPGAAPSPRATIDDDSALQCRDLVVRYGDRVAVDRLTLTAERGEVVALLGPNGAGKTSTVETLEGYRRPAAGTVRVLGLDPVRQHRALVPRIGTMLQRGGIYPIMDPDRALRLFASYYADPADPGGLLDLVGLRLVARTPYRQLSGGEQQRLGLALALVGRPEVVLLDEPTAGVDPEGRVTVRRVVRELATGGACVVVTTHELAEAELWADRVLVLRAGRLAAEGTPDALAPVGDGERTAVAEELRFTTPASLDVGALAAVLGHPVHDDGGGRYRIAAAPSPSLTAALTAWLAERDLPLADLRTSRSLEEAYLDIVGHDAAAAPEQPADAQSGSHLEARRWRSGRRGRPT